MAERLYQGGSVAGIAEAQCCERTCQFNGRRFVDECLEDGIATDLPRLHRGVGALSSLGIQSGYQIFDGGAVVLDLHQPEDVCVKRRQG